MKSSLAVKTFVAVIVASLNCRAATKLSFQPARTNEEAGLVLRGNNNNHCEVGVTHRSGTRQVFLRKMLDGKVVEPVAFADIPKGDLILSVKAKPLNYEFFHQATGNGARSTAPADSDWFEYQPGKE